MVFNAQLKITVRPFWTASTSDQCSSLKWVEMCRFSPETIAGNPVHPISTRENNDHIFLIDSEFTMPATSVSLRPMKNASLVLHRRQWSLLPVSLMLLLNKRLVPARPLLLIIRIRNPVRAKRLLMAYLPLFCVRFSPFFIFSTIFQYNFIVFCYFGIIAAIFRNNCLERRNNFHCSLVIKVKILEIPYPPVPSRRNSCSDWKLNYRQFFYLFLQMQITNMLLYFSYIWNKNESFVLY